MARKQSEGAAGLKTGSFVTVGARFAAEAYRIENGSRTAGAECARGINTRGMAVDEDLGIVLLRMSFGEKAFMKIMPASRGSRWD